MTSTLRVRNFPHPLQNHLFEKAVPHNRILAGGGGATGVALDEELTLCSAKCRRRVSASQAKAAAPAWCVVWQRCALRCCFREREPVSSNGQ
jgi:hypothetical protein